MANYYNDAGKQLKGDGLKKYLKALKEAETSGKPYAGKTYYTRDALEQKYNGFDLQAIRDAGKKRYLLLEAAKEYVGLTDEQLQASANSQVEGEANTATAQANSLYGANKNTLESERSALDQPYQQQVAEAQKQTAQGVDSLTGTMLSRGLGRSSYAGALQSNTLQAGAQNVNGILAEKGQKVGAINGQIGTLGTNYNMAVDTIARNKTSGAKSVFDSLKQTDYQKGMDTSNARTTFLYNLLNQKKKVASGGGSSGGSSGGGSSSAPTSDNAGNGFSDWLADLFK